MTKTFWLLQIGTGSNALYAAHFNKGIAFTRDVNHACKFAEEKYAKAHLINMRAMCPELSFFTEVNLVRKDFDWSREAYAGGRA